MLATPPPPLSIPSSSWVFPLMPGIPWVLAVFYFEPPWNVVLWYLQLDVWLSPVQYLTMTVLYRHYRTLSDSVYILLQSSVIVHLPLEGLLTAIVNRLHSQDLHSLASGNFYFKVPWESSYYLTDKHWWHLFHSGHISDLKGFVWAENTVINGRGNEAAKVCFYGSPSWNIGIISVFENLIPASKSFIFKMYCALSNFQQIILFIVETAMSRR